MKKILIVVIAVLVLTGVVFVLKGNTPKNTLTNNVNNPSVSATPAIVASNSVLNLSGQGLTKAPDYIFNLINLEGLNLSNNSLTGALQAEVRHLQNLKVLDLSNNRFTGVPAEIGQLKNLEVLNLSNNLLTGLPNELGNLSNLKLLDISGNNYSSMDLAAIQKNLPSFTVVKTK